MSDIKPLEADALYRRCDASSFDFQTTADLAELSEVLGQKRATEAIRFAIGMRRNSYGLYVLGEQGAGRSALIDRFVEERARGESSPPDWLYVNNFDDSHKPVALALPPGCGARLRDDMDQLVEDLQGALPAAFESEEYRARRKELEDSLKEKHSEPFEKLGEKAREHGLALLRTERGMAFAPLKEDGDDVMSSEDFNKLPEDEREAYREKIDSLEDELEKIVHQVPRWQREGKRRIRDLDREFAGMAVDNLMEDVRENWREHAEVVEYFDAVREDVVDNIGDFMGEEADQQQQLLQQLGGQQPSMPGQQRERSLRRFRVNVLVDNSDAAGAPVVFENHPSHQNLFGRMEHMSHMGNLFTDFTLLRSGALHRANGGYLVVEAHKLLTQPFAWDSLKRALFSGKLRIESLGQELSLISIVSLEPEALELNVKIILIGPRMLYYLLNQHDPEFGQLFKVAADFEDDMPRDDDNQKAYARMIATQARRENLMALDREAVARVIEQGARAAEDAERISVHLQDITDLLREADYWARERKSDVVGREDVKKAVDARRYRAGRVPEKIQEAIRRGTLLIDTDGEKIGQINGLSVSAAGQTSFGHPSRITARVRLGHGEIKDIQREVKLAGPIFSKAVMTLTGYLGAHYAPDFPLMLGASLVFEQTYGGVEGDSATAAELFALLSALADVPLKQSLAVTGSANQYGQAQPVGGINEKIEGFFDTCNERGLTGEQGVLIPEANVKHLMLREDVVEAAGNGKFHIYPFRSIDEGLGLVTGLPVGEKNEKGRFSEDSVNHRVQERLLKMADQARRWKGNGNGDEEDDEP